MAALSILSAEERACFERLIDELERFHAGAAGLKWFCPGPNGNGKACGSLRGGKERFDRTPINDLVETLLLVIRRCEKSGARDLEDEHVSAAFDIESRHIKLIMTIIYCSPHLENATLAVDAWRRAVASINAIDTKINSGFDTPTKPTKKFVDAFYNGEASSIKTEAEEPRFPHTPVAAQKAHNGFLQTGKSTMQRPLPTVIQQASPDRQNTIHESKSIISRTPNSGTRSLYSATPGSSLSDASSVFSAQSIRTPMTPMTDVSSYSHLTETSIDKVVALQDLDSTPSRKPRRGHSISQRTVDIDFVSTESESEEETESFSGQSPTRALHSQFESLRATTNQVAKGESGSQEQPAPAYRLPIPETSERISNGISTANSSETKSSKINAESDTYHREDFRDKQPAGTIEPRATCIAPTVSEMVAKHSDLLEPFMKDSSAPIQTRIIKVIEEDFSSHAREEGRIYVGIKEDIDFLFKVGWTRKTGLTERYNSKGSEGVDKIVAKTSIFRGAFRVEQLVHADLNRQRVYLVKYDTRNCKTRHKEWFVSTLDHVLNTVELWTRFMAIYDGDKLSSNGKAVLDRILHVGSIVRAFEDLAKVKCPPDSLIVFKEALSFREADRSDERPRPSKALEIIMEMAGKQALEVSEPMIELEPAAVTTPETDTNAKPEAKVTESVSSVAEAQAMSSENKQSVPSVSEMPRQKSHSGKKKVTFRAWDIVAESLKAPNGLKSLREKMKRASLVPTEPQPKEGSETKKEPTMGIIRRKTETLLRSKW